jgi:hypothetical protein
MNISKANKRDKKQRKEKHGMRNDGRSVFLIQAIQIKRAEKIKNGKAKKGKGKK